MSCYEQCSKSILKNFEACIDDNINIKYFIKWLSSFFSVGIFLLVFYINIFKNLQTTNRTIKKFTELSNKININGVLLSLIITLCIKYFYNCENSNLACRPGNNDKSNISNCSSSNGMPSGHSAMASALIGSILNSNLDKNYKYFLIFCNLMVILSRFILNYHTKLQILAGIFIGVLSEFFSNKNFSDLKKGEFGITEIIFRFLIAFFTLIKSDISGIFFFFNLKFIRKILTDSINLISKIKNN